MCIIYRGVSSGGWTVSEVDVFPFLDCSWEPTQGTSLKIAPSPPFCLASKYPLGGPTMIWRERNEKEDTPLAQLIVFRAIQALGSSGVGTFRSSCLRLQDSSQVLYSCGVPAFSCVTGVVLCLLALRFIPRDRSRKALARKTRVGIWICRGLHCCAKYSRRAIQRDSTNTSQRNQSNIRSATNIAFVISGVTAISLFCFCWMHSQKKSDMCFMVALCRAFTNSMECFLWPL